MILFKYKKDRGVTLVELMIAVTIILIAIIPLMSMIIQSVQGTQKLSDRTRASQLVQDMIEEVKQKDWDEDPWNPGQLGYEDPSSEDPTAAGGRLNCNDIDDYIAYDDSSSIPEGHMIENPPVDEAGNELDPSKFGKFVRETIVRYVEVPLDGDVSIAPNDGLGAAAGDRTNFKQVDVWVSWNDTGNPADDAGVAEGVSGDTVWVWEVADNVVHSQTIIAKPAVVD